MCLKFSGRQDVYLEVAEQYKKYIQLGILKNGERLPSVRNAAEEYGINPNTVARAYTHLEQEGYIRTIPKKGVYVTYSDAGINRKVLDEAREALIALRDSGVSQSTLLSLIDEIYGGQHD